MDRVCVRADGVWIDGGLVTRRRSGAAVLPSAQQEAVLLNVYDLHWANRVTRRLRLGAYHTGLQVHGTEFSFGSGGGVCAGRPRDVSAMETTMTFRKSVQLGSTRYNRRDAARIAEQLGARLFTGASYDLLQQNCNHFCEALARALCPQAQFPAWVNSLARVGAGLPFVRRRLRKRQIPTNPTARRCDTSTS